jgi:hypothetical protein
MKKKLHFKLSILLLTLICYNAFSQDQPELVRLDLLDVYIVQFRIDTLAAPFKHYPCSPSKIKRMALYKIEILNVIHHSDTIKFNEAEFKKIKFALSPTTLAKGDFIGSFYPSSSNDYLYFYHIMTLDSKLKYKFIQHAYLSEASCVKRDKALKLIQDFNKKTRKNSLKSS